MCSLLVQPENSGESGQSGPADRQLHPVLNRGVFCLTTPEDITRFHSRAANVHGGISLRLHEDDPDSVIIRFLDGAGADITEASQRKIERLFSREDFRRVRPGQDVVEHPQGKAVQQVDQPHLHGRDAVGEAQAELSEGEAGPGLSGVAPARFPPGAGES